LKSLAKSEPLLTFAAVTAPSFSCALPTLRAGRLLAAQAPPLSARKRARVAITFA
jgi:hypothetical protein